MFKKLGNVVLGFGLACVLVVGLATTPGNQEEPIFGYIEIAPFDYNSPDDFDD